MNTGEKDQIRVKILNAIEETEKKIKSMEDNTQPIGPENAIGRVSRMDAINNKSVTEAALRSAKTKLGKLKVALTNMEKPGFGLCKNCGNPIPIPRLMFMPESNKCVRCADR